MKNILFPTDFSETSKNAFAFAKALAKRQGTSIKAVHVHYPDATALENVPVDMFEETLKMKRERINRFTGQDADTLSEDNVDVLTKVETDIMIGFPGDTIVSLSKEEDIDLIVMGTTGEGGFLEKVFGTVSTHVSRKAGCPVLLVPDGVEFKECSNILFATDEKATDQVLVERVPDIMGCPKADVHFVHVNEVDRPSYKVEDLCFKNPALTGQFHFVQIESKDILEGLNRYTKEENIDAMVMATPRRSFLEGLFHKSMTKQMALNTKMPLLVMHYDD